MPDHLATHHHHPLLPEHLQARYREQGYWEDRTLADFVREWAARSPDRPAVLGEGGLTYSELWDRACRVAGHLQEQGVEPGEAVLAVLASSWQGVVLEVAASVAGWVFVPRSPGVSAASVERLVEQVSGRALIVTAEVLAKPGWTGTWSRLEEAGLTMIIRGGDEANAFEQLCVQGPLGGQVGSHADGPCLVLSTGGTTGTPKSIVHGSNALVYATRRLATALEFTEDDIHISIAPYGHAGGSVFDMYLPLMHGAAVLPVGRWSAADVAASISAVGGTVLMTMGTHLYDLLEVPDAAHLLSSLRIVTSGAAPADLFVRAEAELNIPIVRIYGCGEAPGHAVGRLDDDAQIRLYHDGIPFEGMDNRVVDQASRRELPTGTPGAYQCRGPNLFMGYAGQPELTAACVDTEGFYDTGDTMYFDEHGYVTWSGRTKDIIRRGGLQIDPLEIERILSHHGALASVVVVPRPHGRLGETACVVAVPASGNDVPTLHDLCSYLLENGYPKQELPEDLLLVDALPRTEVGKFHRVAITRRAADMLAAPSAGSPT